MQLNHRYALLAAKIRKADVRNVKRYKVGKYKS